MQELLASLLEQFARNRAVVFDFFESTSASFQAEVVGEVYITHTSLTDALMNAISAAQYVTGFKRDRHTLPIHGERGMAIRG
jgi:hypothetical protein